MEAQWRLWEPPLPFPTTHPSRGIVWEVKHCTVKAEVVSAVLFVTSVRTVGPTVAEVPLVHPAYRYKVIVILLVMLF